MTLGELMDKAISITKIKIYDDTRDMTASYKMTERIDHDMLAGEVSGFWIERGALCVILN